MELTHFAQDDDGVSATLRHADGREESLRAGWLVGCDGAHSAVRHGLGVPFEGAAYPEEFILGDVGIDWPLDPSEAYGFPSESGFLAVISMPGESRYRVISMRSESRDESRGDPTLEEFQELMDRLAPVKATLRDPVWLAEFHLQRRMVPRLRNGRVFLAGDAAHIHSPAGGQGMNTGIQDAQNLAWKLALVVAGASRPDLLDSYQAERHPVAESVLRSTDRLFRGVIARGPLSAWARRHLAPLIVNREWFQRRARRFITELGITYRDSPIIGPTRRRLDLPSGMGSRNAPTRRPCPRCHRPPSERCILRCSSL